MNKEKTSSKKDKNKKYSYMCNNHFALLIQYFEYRLNCFIKLSIIIGLFFNY